MNDKQRLLIASACSILVHAAVIASVCSGTYQYTLSSGNGNESFAITFTPAKQLEPKQLVEARAPTNEDVTAAGLIAEQNTKAQDMSDTAGDANAPHVDEISDFDQTGAPAQPAPPASPTPPVAVPPPPAQSEAPVPPQPAQQTVPESTPPPPQPAPPQDTATGQRASEPAKPAEEVQLKVPDGQTTETKQPETAATTESTAPFQMAQAAQPALMPSLAAQGETHGRVDGGVKREGVIGFEAMGDEMAPYLKEVRSRVETNWRAALQMRYSGTSPTKAVLDCAIRPDGQIESVTIVEAGDSVTYAPLCKEAVEKAGPFQPFPFKVPDMYRNKNLEIRWTFNFLR